MTQASRYVPYAFARDNAILIVPKSERDAEVVDQQRDAAAALNEVMRVFPGKVRPVVIESVKLTEAISRPTATRAARRSRSSATSKASSTSRG